MEGDRTDPFLNLEEPPDAIATALVTDATLSVKGGIEAADPFGLIKNVRVTFHVNGTIPLEPLAPAIDCHLELLLTASVTPAFTYSITGYHEGFPAYELYIQRRLVYSFDPEQAGTSPLDLAAVGNKVVNVPLTVFV